ncbi:hypothetical protein GCM10023086_48290 [Streptomyces venetus]|uniref:Uncharacterized protein n=1 Tax=Streptomyces venetus TaxID=1701086 RepID=A0ABP8GEE3_9ACTN
MALQFCQRQVERGHDGTSQESVAIQKLAMDNGRQVPGVYPASTGIQRRAGAPYDRRDTH